MYINVENISDICISFFIYKKRLTRKLINKCAPLLHQLYTIKELIRNNNLGAFLFNQVLDNDPSLVGIPLEEPIDLEIVIAYRIDSHLNNIAKEFMDFIIDCQKK